MTVPPPLPPDRSGILTEQRNPRSMRLHELSAGDCLRLIHEEDRAVLGAVERAMPAITSLVEAIEPRFVAGGRLVTLGAGTSGRLAVLDASEMPPTFQIDPGRFVAIIAGGDAALRRSSEGKEDDPRGAIGELSGLGLTKDDTLLGVAAGGTTPFVLGALEWARNRPASARPLTAMLSCAPIASSTGDHVVVETGPEVVTGSTRMKAGTATKLVLNMISTTLMVRSGRVYENLMVDLRASNIKLRDRAARIVAAVAGIPRESAFTVLESAGGSAKVAIVMARLGVSRTEAERLLDTAGGKLGDILMT